MNIAPWRAPCAMISVLLAVAAPTRGFPQKSAAFVTASFTDKNGLFIENLEKEEVQISENDQPRQLAFMAREEVPTVYGLIFDRSLFPGSEEVPRMGTGLNVSKASAARDFAYELIDRHLSHQTLWVGAYGRELQVLLDFTSDGFRAKDAIQRISGNRYREEPYLYAALFPSVMRMKERNEKRRVLIVFVDFLDTETVGKLKPLKNAFGSSNVELFFVSFASKQSSFTANYNMTLAGLKSLAQATAGDAFFATDFRDHLDELSRRMYNQLRTFYTFGIESEAPAEKPSKLTIRCTRPGSRVKCHPDFPVIR